MSKNRAPSDLVIGYLGLRRAIGIIGTALPFVLVVGTWLFDGWGIRPSISAYYYTSMRDVFVGSICAIGVFLLSYRGYERADELAGNLACACAVGLALLPASPLTGASATQSLVGHLHLTFAAAFFLTLAYFSLALFRKTDPSRPMTARKKQRNRVYTVCGYTILVCIGLVALDFTLLKGSSLQVIDPVFWLEAAAVLAFGISWLTKGEAILADLAPGAASVRAESDPSAPRALGSSVRGEVTCMIIRCETPRDLDAIRDVNIVAFEHHPFSHQTEHLIVDALRTAEALELSLVAEADGAVVGHIAFSAASIGPTSSGWFLLGPVAVLPEHQRMGIGSALVEAGLDALRTRGVRGCALIGDPAFYCRFGFRQYPGVSCEGVPDENVLCLSMSGDVPTGQVSYHSAFSAGM